MAPFPPHLYIGPGAGIGAVGAMLALLGAFLLMVVGLVWYPVRRLREWRRGTRGGERPGPGAPPAEDRRRRSGSGS